MYQTLFYIVLIAIMFSFIIVRIPVLKKKPLVKYLLYTTIATCIVSVSLLLYYMHFYIGDRDFRYTYVRLFHVTILFLLSSIFVALARKIKL